MNTPAYCSQFGEDKWIVENLNPPAQGTFCEVGAFDGIHSSNTRHFEQLGWHGVCIEADPFNAAKMIQNRDCVCFACAAGLIGLESFSFTGEDRGIGGLKRSFAQSFIVPVIPLEDILKSAAVTSLDILSIDTEGTELDVWRSIGEIRPTIVIVEYFTQGLITDVDSIVAQFVADGYSLKHKTDCNIIFKR
jgi:FkbM family methyltransferase